MDNQQMVALADEWRKQLDRHMGEMKLRQWCVEQAGKWGGSPAELKQRYTDIMEFVSKPFSEVFKSDES